MASRSVQRMDAVSKLISGLKDTYPDAKKLSLDVRFEWQEPNDVNLDSQLCPVVKIEIER